MDRIKDDVMAALFSCVIAAAFACVLAAVFACVFAAIPIYCFVCLTVCLNTSKCLSVSPSVSPVGNLSVSI